MAASSKHARILVSACLIGRPVRYDGRAKTLENHWLERWMEEGRLVSLCPEVAAGFSVPRLPAEIQPAASGGDVWRGGARVLDEEGNDETDGFLRGAHIAVETALSEGCRYALLTDGSPSCGSSFIYSGDHSGSKREGEGVVTAALRAAGIAVFSPSRIKELADRLERE